MVILLYGVYNLDHQLIKKYPSFSEAGKDLGACRKYLKKICDTQVWKYTEINITLNLQISTI